VFFTVFGQPIMHPMWPVWPLAALAMAILMVKPRPADLARSPAHNSDIIVIGRSLKS